MDAFKQLLKHAFKNMSVYGKKDHLKKKKCLTNKENN